MKWYYPLFILVLFLAPSCAVTSIAPVEVVLTNLGDVHAFDIYSSMVNLKLKVLIKKKHLEDKELLLKIQDYNDAVYAYYTRAFVLLAAGDVKGYKGNLDKAWALSQAMEKIADEIYAKISKTEGQGL